MSRTLPRTRNLVNSPRKQLTAARSTGSAGPPPPVGSPCFTMVSQLRPESRTPRFSDVTFYKWNSLHPTYKRGPLARAFCSRSTLARTISPFSFSLSLSLSLSLSRFPFSFSFCLCSFDENRNVTGLNWPRFDDGVSSSRGWKSSTMFDVSKDGVFNPLSLSRVFVTCVLVQILPSVYACT